MVCNYSNAESSWFCGLLCWLSTSVKKTCNFLKMTLQRNAIAMMSACNPEIMEDILNTDIEDAKVRYIFSLFFLCYEII